MGRKIAWAGECQQKIKATPQVWNGLKFAGLTKEEREQTKKTIMDRIFAVGKNVTREELRETDPETASQFERCLTWIRVNCCSKAERDCYLKYRRTQDLGYRTARKSGAVRKVTQKSRQKTYRKSEAGRLATRSETARKLVQRKWPSASKESISGVVRQAHDLCWSECVYCGSAPKQDGDARRPLALFVADASGDFPSVEALKAKCPGGCKSE